jgi:hypothetical protein
MSSLVFIELEEFSDIRREIEALRNDIEMLEPSSARSPIPDERQQIHRHDFQLLLLSIREQNSRAKVLIDMMTSQIPAKRRATFAPANPQALTPEVSVEIYEGFRIDIE